MKTKTQILGRAKTKQTKMKGYNLISKPSSDTNWCRSLDHVVKQPATKLKYNLESPKSGLIEPWPRGNLIPKEPKLLE
jgi:hypothetical protein